MIKIKDLSETFVLKNIIYFESKLYEKLSSHYKHSYRVILSSDDYDYVCDRNLKRRLDRAFAKI